MSYIKAKVFGVLIAALVIAAVAVVPAMAAGGSPEAGSTAVTSEPTAPAVTGEPSPLALSECSENTVCVWSKINYAGTFSWWPGSSTGCHSHAGNPGIKSWWNRTGYTVRLGGWGNVGPHEDGTFVSESESPITGEICWPA